jgi:AcrR family transcriptional regulator
VSASAEPITDGRSLRRARNQEAVVEAILALLMDGQARPTAQQISVRSGVSMRSIFRLFDDMEALHRAAIARQEERIASLLTPLPADGELGERVRLLVDNRAEIFETISPVRRLGVQLAAQSTTISSELARISGFFRDQVATVFAAEIACTAEPNVALDAADVATSWETWDRLRVGQGLSTRQATDVVVAMVTAVLTPTSTAAPTRH